MQTRVTKRKITRKIARLLKALCPCDTAPGVVVDGIAQGRADLQLTWSRRG